MSTSLLPRNSALEITNLLYRYNELIDSGDLAGAVGLFQHAQLKLVTSPELQGYEACLALLQRVVILYADGTPKTKHIVTNPIIDIDEAAGTASSRSQYTVFQATDELPLQVIAGGRYHDRFEYVEGQWRFAYRDYTLFDLRGNTSQHLNLARVME
ncbi:nuclear transport factor 2 family protein [Hymenobacter cellulosivorans]|uniref:Nuclear transport factor 2 family protein n=1 Tax=Hymenobacter cellulosivorans TaxID=2932249 RepID=A0ABY4F6L1_9BACT|nr:nuclear transport factor 2 family protein [Hymenobacter cellulosivorans]UOQ51747.1 nuclear transport factor 2 family protein [Hymenobacter cellulosivorans]